ncbi:MAG: hypothetical protein K2M64_01035, partial [Clostridia bacterium]|nr:hypothetical protein [Clostridia bacterium]
MTSTKRKLMLVVFAVALIVALSAGVVTAFALTTTDTVEYPVTKGTDAFKYAPTWSCGPAGVDHWDAFRISIGELPLDGVEYLAWQIKVNGYASLTVGAVYGEWWSRLDVNDKNGGGTPVDGANVYFVNEDGTVDSINVIYGAVDLSNRTGMLLMPVKNLAWRFGDPGTSIHSFYFTANTLYNSNYKVSTSELGYYTGEPTDIENYHSLVKFALDEDHESYTS